MRCTTLSLALTLLALVQCQGPPNPIGYDDPPSPISDDGSGIVMTPSDLGSSGFLDMTDPSNGNFLGNSPPVPRTCPARRLQGAKDDPRLVNDPACPTDNGDIFITSDGAHFAFQCCAHHPDEGRDKIPDAETNQPSMRDCAELCTQTSGCQSVIFTEVVHGTDVVGTCKLFRTGGYSAAACGGDMHDYAYMTSPPAIDIPEPLTILCSTECPHANGQQYSAKYGEAFTMYCGKRHGTKVIHQDSRETFQDCMDACSRMLPCHSVDYHASSKICYYGKQHSEPQVAASGFASARSVGCAGACSGGGACCQQGTLLEVDDIAKPLPPPARCGNQGIQWAQFTNNQGYNNDGSYSQFRPEIYKGQAPGASGVTSTIGGIDAVGGQQISVYGSSQRFSGDFFTLHHKGYLYASVEGEYKFTVSKVDDALFLWLGDPAIEGWTRSNANLVLGVHGTGSEVVRLARGEYMAFRVVLAQAQDGARFAMEIEGPDGQIIADSQTTSSSWILQYSCDGTSAPEFSTWGAEY